MYKLIARIGAVAAGATFGIYQYGYNGCDDGTCSLNRKSCCSDMPQPAVSDCCATHEACCETQEACCAEKSVSAKKSCCAEDGTCSTGFVSAKTTKNVAEKAALCCVNPCLGCLLVSCESCCESAAGCAACCDADKAKAKAAVAGPAAVVGVR